MLYLKAPGSMIVTLLGISIFNELQPAKAHSPISVMLFGRAMFFNDLQPQKVTLSIRLMLFGMVILYNELQS